AQKSLALAKEQGLREYAGAALGNLAWVAYKRRKYDEAERVGREALSCWKPLALVYPFEWLARLPLLALSLERDRLRQAVAQAGAVLAPRQQRLPREIASPLAKAAAFDARRRSDVRRALERAIERAKQSGYA